MSAIGRKTADDQHGQREVERGHQPRQVPQHAQPAVADGVRDRRTDADRGVVHDDVRDLEHRFGDGLAPGDDRPALLADHAQRNGEEDAEDDDLEDVTLGHRADHRLRDDVEEDLIPGLRLGGDLARLPHRQVDADARLHDVDRREPDAERDGGDDLEIDDRAQPHAADDLDVAGAGDAGDQRREDQRRDDHLDHPQEQLAEGAEVRRPLGMGRADDPSRRDADRKTDENLLGEGNAAAGRRRRGVAFSWILSSELAQLPDSAAKQAPRAVSSCGLRPADCASCRCRGGSGERRSAIRRSARRRRRSLPPSRATTAPSAGRWVRRSRTAAPRARRRAAAAAGAPRGRRAAR